MNKRHLELLLCALGACAAAVRADDWPQFRGPNRDNISKETGLLHKWPEGGPKVLWTVEVCQGYAAPAIHSGKAYFEDYNPEAKEWCLRCLSLEGGKEQWRFKESKTIRPNHGITRTVPATDGKFVFSLDPKCVFHCLDAQTGRELWRKDLVETYKAQIPPWYNGQCPLIEPDRVIIGAGGEALVVAFDKATGNEVWKTPNPEKWPLAHASVMPAELGGVKQYTWCTLFGPLGVSAADGKLLWHCPRKFNVAVAPSPLPIAPDRVFMTAGYDAGSVMVRVTHTAGTFAATSLFELTTDQWNSEVHTPILWQNHLFAVGKKERGLFSCLDLDGKIVWTSAGKASFGLGSYIFADGMFFVLEGDTGLLRLLDANPAEYRELDHAQLLSGDNVWAPLALSNGKLILRDMAKMICIEVGPETK
jgi:outer membrane protein assembly factor BamB